MPNGTIHCDLFQLWLILGDKDGLVLMLPSLVLSIIKAYSSLVHIDDWLVIDEHGQQLLCSLQSVPVMYLTISYERLPLCFSFPVLDAVAFVNLVQGSSANMELVVIPEVIDSLPH